MEFQCFEVKPEADSPHDDKPSTGMFAVYDAALSALTSSCGSVVSCGSVIESPCKLQTSAIKVIDDVMVGILSKLLSYFIKVLLGYPILWTERRVLKLSLLCICR